MTNLAQRRARILRVRQVQHLQAASDAAAADARVVHLESSGARLAELRESLAPAAGRASGASLGHAGKLAGRLDAARHGLRQATDDARVVAIAAADTRLDARIAREGAARLQSRAVAEMQREIERRMLAAYRPRAMSRGRDD